MQEERGACGGVVFCVLCLFSAAEGVGVKGEGERERKGEGEGDKEGGRGKGGEGVEGIA